MPHYVILGSNGDEHFADQFATAENERFDRQAKEHGEKVARRARSASIMVLAAIAITMTLFALYGLMH